jgi:hypothetical protein
MRQGCPDPCGGIEKNVDCDGITNEGGRFYFKPGGKTSNGRLYIEAISDMNIIVQSALSLVLMAASAAGQSESEKKDQATEPKTDKEIETVQKDKEKENKERDTTATSVSMIKSQPFKFGSDYERSGAANTDSAKSESEPQQAPAEDAQALAKKLSNPVSSLISLPFQHNFDFGMGPNGDGFKYTLNIQPVIPITLNKDWNLISRTILPVVYQSKVVGTTSQFGLSDTVQTFFFSPNKTDPFIWGVGPQFLIPTGTNPRIRSQKFGMGPSFLILKQKGPLTVGLLATHMWSVAGSSTRADVNSTFLQPFLAYTTKSAWTYTFNTESTYDWTGNTWAVPIHAQVTKLVKIGKQPVSVGGALRCWASSGGPSGPTGCGFRLIFTPLFPKK